MQGTIMCMQEDIPLQSDMSSTPRPSSAMWLHPVGDLAM